MKTHYGIIGAGGHGREIMPIVHKNLSNTLPRESYEIYFVIEGEVNNKTINEKTVIDLESFLSLPGNKFFNIAIADSRVRERISIICENHGATPLHIQSENTVILDNNEIGRGAMLSQFVTITSNVKIGKYFHANMYSHVAHDCVIGDFVTFAPGVKCNGNILIEDHAYIGSGAIIKQGTSEQPLIIGQGAIIGMGAVVTKSVAPGETVIGNPAKPMKHILKI